MTTQSPKTGFWKRAFIYGFPAGLITILTMIAGLQLGGPDSGASSQLVGFIIMILAFSLIFFGILKFRDEQQGGIIKFKSALGLGLAMSLFAGIAYIIVWEIYLSATDFSFMSEYTSTLLAKEEAKGVSGAELEAFMDKMKTMNESYKNPLFRIPLTFTEIFPVGFVMTLIASLFLHNPKFWARNT